MLDFLNGLLAIRDVDQIWLLIGFIAVEVGLVWLLRKQYYAATDTLCSVTLGLAYAASIALAAGTVLAVYYWIHQFAVTDIDWTGSVVAILAAYVIVDFLFYWYHRAIHEVRLGWAAHVNHHSSQFLNAGTALRSSFVEAWFEPVFLIPAVLLGMDPLMVVALISLNHLYQYWLHTRLIGKLGPMEWIMNTPSHHRVHHASNIRYCDKNYAGTFIVWDRLFGTFEAEREDEPCIFGIRHQLETRNPIKVTFHEWVSIWQDMRNAPSLSAALGYLFQPPGWSPDGNGETTRAVQAKARADGLI
ncbi:MAG: sterol desaturase family protein [Candidatus Phaeomarinobacter sp.]